MPVDPTPPQTSASQDTSHREDPVTDEPSGFAELGLSGPVLEALSAVGYEVPTPIQARTIPHLAAGRDLLGQAQTGTGKTAAFALPLLSRVDIGRRQPQILVLVPTRELAIQVSEAFQKYAARLRGFHVLPIYGGQAYERQLRPLGRGVHVIVGTPGRVMDHMRRGTLDLDGLSTVVLDEADEMLRMGFIADVEWVLDQTPDSVQVALFSATLPPAVRKIAQQHLTQPAEVTIETKARAADSIRQRFCLVGDSHKLDALTRVLEAETCEGVIVFVRTKSATTELAERLEARGHAAAALNGDIPQAAREKTIERLKAGRIEILVATDVAARGLDVERISHVINFDVPHDAESYVHRIGRTGRAGRAGEAILFVTPRERRLLRLIERSVGCRIEPMVMPTSGLINSRRIARFKQKITDTLRDGDLDFFGHLVNEYREETGAPIEAVAAALAHLAQGDQPFLLPDLPDITPKDVPLDRKGRRKHGFEPGMESFRIEVGREHGARHAAIVGAIANEAGIPGKHIGRIKIFADYSVVDLPGGMPRDIFEQLQTVRVRHRPLRISRLNRRPRHGPRRHHGSKGDHRGPGRRDG